MLELLSDEKLIKMISTTTYELALVEDVYGYFVAYSKNGEAHYGTPFKDYHLCSAVFEDIHQELEGN
jgi:hypothetical protein